jgi:hypothetical protein
MCARPTALAIPENVVRVAGAAPAGVLPAGLVAAEPQAAGPLAVFPLFASPGEFEYWSFAEAAARGFRLEELRVASVNDLRATNPLDVPVLLTDAEVVEGAQQDRVADVPVLVDRGMRRTVPVCCVEHGRWEEARHREAFGASACALAPSLRARKNQRVRDALALGGRPRADQEEVWEHVEDALHASRAKSRTGAVRDLYARHRERLAELESEIHRRDGQLGALVCLEGRPVVLDYVSRPEVWAALWRPLLRGYCLDALACPTGGPEVRAATADAFLATADAVAPVRHPGTGMGDLIALEDDTVAGTGLMLGREVVAVSVFARARP